MYTLLAIDPGNLFSGWVTVDERGNPIKFGNEANGLVLERITPTIDLVAIEKMSCYGKPVGAEVHETNFWSGRFWERARNRHGDVTLSLEGSLVLGQAKVVRYNRSEVKSFLGLKGNCKDSDIKAQIERHYGDKGTMGNPGRLHGFSSHIWQAYALALCALWGAEKRPWSKVKWVEMTRG